MRSSCLATLMLLAACSSPAPGTDGGEDAGGQDAGTDAGALLTSCPASPQFGPLPCTGDFGCSFGTETCCGQTHPSITCSCAQVTGFSQRQFTCRNTDACLSPMCPDAGSADAGTDAGSADAGTDAGTADAGTPDAGPCLVERRERAGSGTSYTPGTVPVASRCNAGLPNTTVLRAAIAGPDFDGGLCGACARVRGDAGTAVVLLDDWCPSCASGDLDFTEEALQAVTGMTTGREPITWELVPCPVMGNILVDLQGSNPFYVKLRLSNHRIPLASVAVRPAGAGAYAALSRTADNFWVLTGGGPYGFPIDVRATDVLGQQLDLVLPELITAPVDAGGQFPEACAP